MLKYHHEYGRDHGMQLQLIQNLQDMNDDQYLQPAEKLNELKSALKKDLDLLCR